MQDFCLTQINPSNGKVTRLGDWTMKDEGGDLSANTNFAVDPVLHRICFKVFVADSRCKMVCLSSLTGKVLGRFLLPEDVCTLLSMTANPISGVIYGLIRTPGLAGYGHFTVRLPAYPPHPHMFHAGYQTAFTIKMPHAAGSRNIS